MVKQFEELTSFQMYSIPSFGFCGRAANGGIWKGNTPRGGLCTTISGNGRMTGGLKG
jgi:hypothetical protein